MTLETDLPSSVTTPSQTEAPITDSSSELEEGADAPEALGIALERGSPGSQEFEHHKPRLFVDPPNPEQTVAHLRDIFAQDKRFYDRAGPARVFKDVQGETVAHGVTVETVVREAHN